MKSMNKKSPAARGIPQPFKAPNLRPVVVQSKTGVSAQSVKQPVAPVVYRPQATPKVLQTKSVVGRPSIALPVHTPQAGPRVVQLHRNTPVAPPVYRPQPVPRVLQAKSALPQRAGQSSGRPEQKIFQPKIAQARTPPHVNRPVPSQSKGVAQAFLRDAKGVVWMGGKADEYWAQNRTHILAMWASMEIKTPPNLMGIIQNMLDKNVTEYTLDDLTEAVAPRLRIRDLGVTTTSDGLTLSGSLSTGTPISGGVMLPTYRIDPTGKSRIEPTREEHSGPTQKEYPRAIRVHNITANPKGMKLGDFVAYFAGRRARELGISYIVALHVVPEARNFYLRLGFREYDLTRQYDLLLKAKEDIARKLEKKSDVSLLEKQLVILEQMVEATLYVPVDTLMTKAVANWNSMWRKTGPGAYVKK